MANTDWGKVGVGAGMGLLGMVAGHQAQLRQFRQEKQLMHQQYSNQLGLNRQGHDLQFDMWNKTNYGAQVQHMIDAGLNPALMYGSAGQGGQTGSQTGGSAAKGSVQQMQAMDLSNALLGAQIGKIDAETKEILGETPEKKAVITELETRSVLNESNINLNDAQINQVTANINKLEADTELTKTIQEKDYGGQFGKNMTQNIIDIVSGKLDLSTYLGLASAIGGLTVLRSPKLLGKLSSKTKEAITGAITILKGKLKGVKKPPTKGKTWEFSGKTLEEQQKMWDQINRRRNMGID
mgnify:CR=1 FL=1